LKPTDGVHTENFFTPLYTESQETVYTTNNTNQRTPGPMRTYVEATLEADLVAAADEAEAHEAARVVELE
jgi:hypothetical protein